MVALQNMLWDEHVHMLCTLASIPLVAHSAD